MNASKNIQCRYVTGILMLVSNSNLEMCRFVLGEGGIQCFGIFVFFSFCFVFQHTQIMGNNKFVAKMLPVLQQVISKRQKEEADLTQSKSEHSFWQDDCHSKAIGSMSIATVAEFIIMYLWSRSVLVFQEVVVN